MGDGAKSGAGEPHICRVIRKDQEPYLEMVLPQEYHKGGTWSPGGGGELEQTLFSAFTAPRVENQVASLRLFSLPPCR